MRRRADILNKFFDKLYNPFCLYSHDFYCPNLSQNKTSIKPKLNIKDEFLQMSVVAIVTEIFHLFLCDPDVVRGKTRVGVDITFSVPGLVKEELLAKQTTTEY